MKLREQAPQRAKTQGALEAFGTVPKNHPAKDEPDTTPCQALVVPSRGLVIRARIELSTPAKREVEEWVEVARPNGKVLSGQLKTDPRGPGEQV